MPYPPEVERWRPLVAKYFPPELVDKALYVIQGESGGRPEARGDQGVAIGLFQIQDNTRFANRPTAQQLADPEANIAYAAKQLGAAGGNWAPWGEGVTYQGKAFGALGNKPYPGNGNTPVGAVNMQIPGVPGADTQIPIDKLPPWAKQQGQTGFADGVNPETGIYYQFQYSESDVPGFAAKGWSVRGTPDRPNAASGSTTIKTNPSTGKSYVVDAQGNVLREVTELAQTPEQKKLSEGQQRAQAATNIGSLLSGRSAPAAARGAPAAAATAPAPGAATEDFATSVSPGASGGNRPFKGAAQDDPNTMMNEAADPGIESFLTEPTDQGWQSAVKYSPEGDFLGVDFATGPNSSMYIRPEHAQGLPASVHSPSSGYVTSYGVKPTGNPERDVGTMLALMSERAIKQREYQNLGLDANKALAIANQEVTNKASAISQAQLRQQLEPSDNDFVASNALANLGGGGGGGTSAWQEAGYGYGGHDFADLERLRVNGGDPYAAQGAMYQNRDPIYQNRGGSGVGGARMMRRRPTMMATGGSGVGGARPPRPLSKAGLMLDESYDPGGGGSTDWVYSKGSNNRARLLQGHTLLDVKGRSAPRPGPEGFHGTWDEYLEWLQEQRLSTGGTPSRTFNPYPPIMPGEDDVGTAGGDGGFANSGGFPYRPVPARNTGAPPLMMNRGGSGMGGGFGQPQDDFMTQEELGVFGLGSGKLYSVVGEGRDGIGGEQKSERFTVTPTDDFATKASQPAAGRELMPDMSPKARKAFAILSA